MKTLLLLAMLSNPISEGSPPKKPKTTIEKLSNENLSRIKGPHCLDLNSSKLCADAIDLENRVIFVVFTMNF